MNGYTGKILHVYLSNSEITQLPTQPYAEQFLGGRGIASRIYWETVAPEIKAFDPENRLIFMTGPLVATGVPGATRLSVVGKSPMVFPEGYCYGNLGGFFPAELKRAGFDGIVLTGRAPKPVYLWIHDDKAELRDASSLWGRSVFQVESLLQQAHGKRVRYLTTGVSGENKVRTAVLLSDRYSAATGGFGAVMGSKNFKAVAVIGNGRPSVADPDKLKELNQYTLRIGERMHKTIFVKQDLPEGHPGLMEVIAKSSCYQCGFDYCSRSRYRYSNGREGVTKCSPRSHYPPWKYSQENEPVDTFRNAPMMANDYSICTIEVATINDLLYKCYQSNALTERETGLPLSKIGTREYLEKLLHSIAYREGFGDILAEGLFRAREKFPVKAQALFSYSIAPVGRGDSYFPRLIVTNALLHAMEPRMHQSIVHRMGWIYRAWLYNLENPDDSPVTGEIVRAVAKAFWGSEEAGDLSGYDGKALAAKLIQDRMYFIDSLGLCDFSWPILFSYNTADHVGDPDLEAKVFSAVTGINDKGLSDYGEAICNLQRLILLREGLKVPAADFPPEYCFTEAFIKPAGLHESVFPGPYGKPLRIRTSDLDECSDSCIGGILDREKYTSMLRGYYRLRGWDEETGLPPDETLGALGLKDLATI